MVYNISSKWHKPSDISGLNSNQWQEFRVVYWTRPKTKERYPSILIPRERKFACLTCFHTFPTLDEVAGHAEIHLRTRRGYVDNSPKFFGENSKLIPKVKLEDDDDDDDDEISRRIEQSSDEYSDSEAYLEDEDRSEFNNNLNEQTKRINSLLKIESINDFADFPSGSISDLASDTQSESNFEINDIDLKDKSSNKNLGEHGDNNNSSENGVNSNKLPRENVTKETDNDILENDCGTNRELLSTPETTSNLSTKLAKLISSKKVNPLLQIPSKHQNVVKQKLTLPEISGKASIAEKPNKLIQQIQRTAPITTTISPMSTSEVEDNSSPSLFVSSDETTDSSSSDEFVSADEGFSDAEESIKLKKKRRRRITKVEKRKLALLEEHPELDSQFVAYTKSKKQKVTQMSLEEALSQAAQLGNRKPLPSWQKKYLAEKPNVEMEKLIDLQEVIANKSVDFEERVKEDKRRLPKKINEKLSNDIPNQFLQFLQPPSA